MTPAGVVTQVNGTATTSLMQGSNGHLFGTILCPTTAEASIFELD